ncbi:MAG: FixH family protein [Nitrospiraceae bacterium]|nr:FixH family protein [Nitrospiraceae bacterium]
MKRLAVIGMVLLLMAGLAYAKDYEVKKKAGAYDVVVSIDKNPPVVGDNNVTISISDAGRDVTDAKVMVDYGMPAMPGMPAMNYKANAALKGTSYAAKMNLSMSGPWSIIVKISRGGKTSSMKFTVDAK